VERDRAEHVAVVGDPDRLHAELLGALDQLGKLGRPVEQRVLGVLVKVNELGRQ